MDRKESFFWNFVKGAAIFLMLWGHCIQYCTLDTAKFFEDIVFKVIYSFHMPVFMLVSGYLFYYSFRKRNLQDLLEHRIRGMLHPIVMATFVNNVLMQIPVYILSKRGHFLFGSLFHGLWNDLWFLWAVLYCSVVVGVCCKLTDRPLLQLLLTVLSACVLLLLPQWNMTLFMYPYFAAGFFCGMYRGQAKKLYQFARYAVWVIFPVLLRFYETKHYIYITPMYSEELGLAASAEIACFRWLIGFVGSIWMLSAMELLLRLGSRVPGGKPFLQAVSGLGRNSLQIYCLSASLLSGYLPHLYRKFVELMGYSPFSENWMVYDFLFTPALAVIWSVLLYYVVALLKRIRLHGLIFGR